MMGVSCTIARVVFRFKVHYNVPELKVLIIVLVRLQRYRDFRDKMIDYMPENGQFLSLKYRLYDGFVKDSEMGW